MRDSASAAERKKIAPVLFSLMDINLAVVDPIAPACYLFDRVRYFIRHTLLLIDDFRDLDITVGRIRLAAGEIVPPKTAASSLQRLIWDQCWINKHQKSTTEHDPVPVNSELQRDPTPMIALKIHEDPEMEITTVSIPI